MRTLHQILQTGPADQQELATALEYSPWYFVELADERRIHEAIENDYQEALIHYHNHPKLNERHIQQALEVDPIYTLKTICPSRLSMANIRWVAQRYPKLMEVIW
jgi:hypothetical protein